MLHGEEIGDNSASVLPTELAVAMLLKHSVDDIALEKNERGADGVVVTVPTISYLEGVK